MYTEIKSQIAINAKVYDFFSCNVEVANQQVNRPFRLFCTSMIMKITLLKKYCHMNRKWIINIILLEISFTDDTVIFKESVDKVQNALKVTVAVFLNTMDCTQEMCVIGTL